LNFLSPSIYFVFVLLQLYCVSELVILSKPFLAFFISRKIKFRITSSFRFFDIFQLSEENRCLQEELARQKSEQISLGKNFSNLEENFRNLEKNLAQERNTHQHDIVDWKNKSVMART
jgi:hypothetical protein